ncbi:tape measure protein [Micavibrio aeruginosavorus]|uniref:Tape measure domain protein n=1 Tax=Micavibrio aeruginosavorus (strain ARL-13) TaxID=856793 RepID=G2KLQ5_MICAA|nr:tape measure protein [Micavibrio aeruginosavorus]AEP08885.1 tape measure domain protein [Micavibrio aeruginosavorus ARL-13]
MTTDAEIVVAVRGETNGGRTVKRTLDDIANSGDKVTSATQRAERQMQSLDRAAGALRNTMMGLLGAFGIQQILKSADSYQVLMARIQGVTRATGDYTRVSRELFDISQRTGSALEGNIQLFQRINIGAKELEKTNSEVLALSETINQLGLLGGASTMALAAGTMQFSQAMAGGILRAEEFNSIMENIPEVGAAIAKGMNLTVGSLRQAVLAGEVLAKDVFDSLAGQSAEIAARFADMPLSLARATQMLSNALQKYIGETDATIGGTQSLAKAVAFLAENIDVVGNTVLILAGSALPALAAAISSVVIPALAALAAALLANPIMLLATILAGASTAAIIFRDDLAALIDPMATFGDVADEVLLRVKNNVYDLIDGLSILILTLKKVLPGELSAYDQGVIQNSKTSIRSRSNTPLFGGFSESVADRAADRVMKEASKNQLQYGGKLEAHLRGVAASSTQAQKAYQTWLGTLSGKGSGGGGGGQSGDAKSAEETAKKLAALVKSTATEQEKYNAKIKELEALRGYAKTAEEITAIERGIKAAGDELEKVRVQAERNGPVAKAFESLANQIDDGFRDAFRTGFTESDGGFKKLIEGWKSTFKTFLADLAYMALARPVILSVVGGIGGAMGISSGAQASILGDIGGTGGGGLGGIGNLLGLGKNLLTGGSITMAQGFTGLYNTGAGLGSSLGLSFEASGMLGKAFGGLPFGALGGLGANLLGLGSGNGLVDTGLGTVGSLIGGGFGGPIGAAIGGFLGTAVGGLFSGGPKRETIGTSYNVGKDGLLGINAVSTKGVDMSKANQFAEGVTKSLNAVASALNATFAQAIPLIETNIGKKDTGTFWGGSRSKISSTAGDINAVIRQVLNSDSYLTGANSDVMAVARRSLSLGSDVEQLVSDITFARSILEDTATPAESAAEAIKQINEQFDAMYTRAAQLGLPLDKVTEALEKQRDVAIGAVKAMQAGFQSMEAMKATFDGWLYEQSMSSVSSASPMDKLKLAQDQFGKLLSTAQGGDYSVTQDLLKAAQQLLTVGQGVYASSTSFAALESFVRSSIGQIAKELDIPGYATGTASAPAGLAWVGERGPELVRFRGGERVHTNQESMEMVGRSSAQMEVKMAENNEQIAAMRKDLREMSRQLSRVANQMIVARS